MLIPGGDPPSKKPALADEGISQFVKSVAILRIGAGLLLAWFHARPGVIGSYQFLWQEQPWEWVRILEKAHVPYPHLIAPAAALVIASVALSWMLGFVTRLFAVFFIPVLIGAFVVSQRVDPSYAETCGLYLIVALTLLLFGSGNISLDWLFKLGRETSELPKVR